MEKLIEVTPSILLFLGFCVSGYGAYCHLYKKDMLLPWNLSGGLLVLSIALGLIGVIDIDLRVIGMTAVLSVLFFFGRN